ncbi:hypothetical protein FKM82_024620 [Ascaphus truei]
MIRTGGFKVVWLAHCALVKKVYRLQLCGNWKWKAESRICFGYPGTGYCHLSKKYINPGRLLLNMTIFMLLPGIFTFIWCTNIICIPVFRSAPES